MRINSFSHLSFKSIPIYDVKVKKRGLFGYKNVDATFCLLDSDDNKDVELVKKVGDSFGKGSIAQTISNMFQKSKSPDDVFYSLELKGKKRTAKSVISLCSGHFANGLFIKRGYVNFIQSVTGSNRLDKYNYKGAGEVMLCGFIKEAKRKGMDDIKLTSADSAKLFYEHIGFVPLGSTSVYTLSNTAYDKYIERVEEKYKEK